LVAERFDLVPSLLSGLGRPRSDLLEICLDLFRKKVPFLEA
jgi:hypothetical protein